jgi:hypothetical protein
MILEVCSLSVQASSSKKNNKLAYSKNLITPAFIATLAKL